MASGQDVLIQVQSIVALLTERPVESIEAGHRLLEDLDLDSSRSPNSPRNSKTPWASRSTTTSSTSTARPSRTAPRSPRQPEPCPAHRPVPAEAEPGRPDRHQPGTAPNQHSTAPYQERPTA